MATSQPCTSDDTDPLLLDENGELCGYGKESYTFLKYVVKEMKEEKKGAGKDKDPLKRAQRLTGLHMGTLEKLREGDIIVNELTDINRRSVHDVLMSFYIDKHTMPTATELFDSLQDILPPYEDIRSFKNKLVTMGYVFQKKENNFVVYETPSIRFERFLYLKNIIQYRQDERPIYYISEVSLSYKKVCNIAESMLNENSNQSRLFFVVSCLKGVQFSKKVASFDKDNFNSWLLNDVIPNLKPKSVVILDNTEHHCDTYCETPNKNSPSYVMVEWLKFHEIPFTKSMSIVELYTLIEKYTDIHTKLYKPDTWLKQNGHNVLRLPDCINEMTPAAHVRHLMFKSGLECSEDLLIRIEDYINETELKTFNSLIVEEETRLYNLEIKLDIVIDNLKPSLNAERDKYLPSLSDSD